MFSKSTAADKLAIALNEYRIEFERSLRQKPNPDAVQARERVEQARELVRRSGLGSALVAVLEDIKHWPSWSKRPDFMQYVNFPVSDVLATNEDKQETYSRTSTTTIYFLYAQRRYGLVFTDNGFRSGPDDSFCHGKVDFVADDQVVLGLNISLDGDDFPVWHWFDVYALKVGDWAKHLLEMAEHIRMKKEMSQAKYHDDDVLNRAKNIHL